MDVTQFLGLVNVTFPLCVTVSTRLAMSNQKENWDHFLARVYAKTGSALGDLPRKIVSCGDCLPGQILCRRGSVYVCTNGYPVETLDDGTEIFEDFVVVYVAHISNSQYPQCQHCGREMSLTEAANLGFRCR